MAAESLFTFKVKVQILQTQNKILVHTTKEKGECLIRQKQTLAIIC